VVRRTLTHEVRRRGVGLKGKGVGHAACETLCTRTLAQAAHACLCLSVIPLFHRNKLL
jgi:hypothetical protein